MLYSQLYFLQMRTVEKETVCFPPIKQFKPVTLNNRCFSKKKTVYENFPGTFSPPFSPPHI